MKEIIIDLNNSTGNDFVSVAEELSVDIENCNTLDISANEITCAISENEIAQIKTHNKLQGLQGGNDENRYHLNFNQYSAATNALSPSVNNPFVTTIQLGETSATLPDGVTVIGDVTINDSLLVTVTEPFSFRINNQIYQSETNPLNTIQLEPRSLTLSRIDTLYVNIDGTYGIVKGVEALIGIQVPIVPNGKILLAQFFISSTEPITIDIQPSTNYYKTTGGPISGPVTILAGNDLTLKSSSGTDDSGDIIFSNSSDVEKLRLWKRPEIKEFLLRFDETDDFNVVLHTGNSYNKQQIDQSVIFKNDLNSKALVSPIINANWTLFNNNGTTPYTPSNSNSKNLTVDKGVVANLNANYVYPSSGLTTDTPTFVSGSFGTVLPAPTITSSALVVNGITNNNNYNVVLSKPKTGLVVVNGQVKYPEGNDTTSDNISISFRSKAYVGYAITSTITSAQILNLANEIFSSSRSRTVTGITANNSQFTYIVYEASFGALSNIIMDGAAPVLSAFTRLPDVVHTNIAGINITMTVYKSNSTLAFTNNNLTIS